MRRKEDMRLLTGQGCYSDDFNFPDQAYGAAVRAPHGHALIRSIDVEAARAMPGVLAVLTGKDADADGIKPIPHHANPGTPPDIVLKNRDGSAVPVAPHLVLPTDRVRYVGTAVAFVIAETVAAAKDAAERVAVEYEPLPSEVMAVAAAERKAPKLYDDIPNILIDADVGDPAATEEAFARAAHVTRLDTWIQRVTGVPMEPRASVGVYDKESGRYVVVSAQASLSDRNAASALATASRMLRRSLVLRARRSSRVARKILRQGHTLRSYPGTISTSTDAQPGTGLDMPIARSAARRRVCPSGVAMDDRDRSCWSSP